MKLFTTPTSRILGVIFVIIIIVVLGVLVLTPPDDDGQHNHFVGSGTLVFTGGKDVQDFYDVGGVDSLGSGFNEQYKCLDLREYGENEIIHFHHTFTYGGFGGSIPVNIKTSIIQNETILSSPSPITIKVDSKTQTFSDILVNPLQITTLDTKGNTLFADIVLDFHIPRSSINYRDSIYLLFETLPVVLDCTSCNQHPTNSLDYFTCVETSNTCSNKTNNTALYKVIKACGSFGPQF